MLRRRGMGGRRVARRHVRRQRRQVHRRARRQRRQVHRRARRTRRQVQRRQRRTRRRRILVGGAVLLAGGYAAYKLTRRDTQRVEEYTGRSAEDLSEEDLVDAMDHLGIQKIELDDEDQALVTEAEEPAAPAADYSEEEGPSYLDDLERLGKLRDEGVITDEEFAAKKQRLLGL